MTGFTSKRRIALDRLDDDDIQIYAQPEGEHMKEALKLALEALEAAEIDGNCEYGVTEIIREALAQPEQEPIGEFKQSSYGNYPTLVWNNGYIAKFGDKLYTTPPKRPWVGLTENEIEAIEEKALTKQWAIRMALTAAQEKNT